MQLRFLGTGTSAGIPIIACDCSVCTSTDPRDTRTRTSAILEFVDPDGHRRVILIDASPDLRQQVLREGIDRIDAILITHNHVDHVWGLDEVRRFNEVMGCPIEVWADDHTHESLRRVYRHIFESEKNIQKSFVADLIPKRLFPDVPITLFGLTITPMTLMHGKQAILGFRFESESLDPGHALLPLAYCTDVVEIPGSSRVHLRGLNTLVLGALRHRPHPTHFTVAQALAEAEGIKASRTFLVHMTHDLGHAVTNGGLSGCSVRVVLAHDGLIVGDSVSS